MINQKRQILRTKTYRAGGGGPVQGRDDLGRSISGSEGGEPFVIWRLKGGTALMARLNLARRRATEKRCGPELNIERKRGGQSRFIFHPCFAAKKKKALNCLSKKIFVRAGRGQKSGGPTPQQQLQDVEEGHRRL